MILAGHIYSPMYTKFDSLCNNYSAACSRGHFGDIPCRRNPKSQIPLKSSKGMKELDQIGFDLERDSERMIGISCVAGQVPGSPNYLGVLKYPG
jgi:hypothetical protein